MKRIDAAMAVVGVLVVAAILALLTACAQERYEEGFPPHESWKDRDEYCFAVEADPHGDNNTVYFWSDDVTVTDDGGTSIVRGKNVRLSIWHSSEGNAEEDRYLPSKVEIIEDGSISVEGRCSE